MLHVGLDLSRKRVDVCLISDQGELVDELAAPFDEDGLCRLANRVAAKHPGRVRAVVKSMNGARFVHDTLEARGWDVLVADAQRVKGLAHAVIRQPRQSRNGVFHPRSTRAFSPRCRFVIWCRRSGCPTRGCDGSASSQGFACTWCATARA
jgi:hypothetical protein